MFKSLRVRFTMIYFLLVFIAMIVAGVFIIRAFEDYNLDVVSERLDDLSQIMMSELSKIELDNGGLEGSKTLIQETIDWHADIGLREEIYVVDASTQQIVATSTENLGRQASEILNTGLVVEGMLGRTVEKNLDLENVVKTKDKVYPILSNGSLIGILYLRYDLTDIYSSMSQTQFIILQAIGMSLAVTILSGIIIAKSITEPINEITQKANRLAEGDFNQIVEVRSDDEIGSLSKSFNFLSAELKRSVSEISSEKSKLETIINYMEDGLIAINADGQVIHSNPKALKLLAGQGQGPENARFDEDLIGDLLSIYSSGKVNNGNGSKNLSYRGQILRVNFAPFLDESSNKVGVVFVLQDVTEEERLENMRREFVANVSHELKTPLTSIKSYAETLLDGDVEDRGVQDQFLQVINTEADRMSRLVRDLLELSNFDSQSVRLNLERHNVNRLLDNCVLKLQVTINQNHQTVQKSYASCTIDAVFDYDKIEQVVLNILSNAVKYSGEGTDISINLKEAESTFEIAIKDGGTGISENDLERVFERFYRVDKARSRANGGTGLGLSIAKEIVEAHHGQIEIQSALGKGTTVRITLPFNGDFDAKNV
ncbi:MAG: two-component system, OmpR family, sensor histidine kinase VicK [Clostridiales bacterium]|nr:two-component system, OmpR family, sensor histidine kinase VicK [Clostridiales bacterium]